MDANINPQVEQMTSFIVMDVLERAVELQKEGKDIIHLEVGEPDFEPSACVLDAARAAYENGNTHYTHSLGDMELRQEISDFYKREYGVSVSPDRILVTSGSSPAILMALQVLCEAGSEVIISNPGYPCYRNFVLACHAKPVLVDVLAEEAFQYPIEEVKRKITDKTRAIFVNSPMNPTGTLVSDNVYQELAKLNVPIISDEIYSELTYDVEHCSPACIPGMRERTIVVNGFSKAFAMTGWRLGYICAPAPLTEQMLKIHQYGIMSSPTTSQFAAIEALKNGDEDIKMMVDEYNRRRRYIYNGLRSIGIESFEPEGAFYIFPSIEKFGLSSEEFCERLLYEGGVAIVPGNAFGESGEGFARISYAYSIKHITQALERIEAFVKTL